jgi:hypothetical protein
MHPTLAHVTTSTEHLHAVLDAVNAHVDDTAAPLRGFAIGANGDVNVQVKHLADLDVLRGAFGLDAATPVLPAISLGQDWAVVRYVCCGKLDGRPMRVWAAGQVTCAEYADMCAARRAAQASGPEHGTVSG